MQLPAQYCLSRQRCGHDQLFVPVAPQVSEKTANEDQEEQHSNRKNDNQ
jgi:hypothetical protein